MELVKKQIRSSSIGWVSKDLGDLTFEGSVEISAAYLGSDVKYYAVCARLVCRDSDNFGIINKSLYPSWFCNYNYLEEAEARFDTFVKRFETLKSMTEQAEE